jgi:hypothetical protein
MTKQLILARYNEKVDWVKNLPPDIEVIIYNKGRHEGNNLPNIGREAHTYLHHLCNGKLADRMVFAQADPFYHCGNHFIWHMLGFLNGLNDFESLSSDTLTISEVTSGDWKDFGNWSEFGKLNGKTYLNHHAPSSAIIQVAQKHFPDRIAKGWEFGPGACFGVSLEAVRGVKWGLLSNLLEYSQSNPENPIHGDESHVMERIWGLIFTS